jgi:HlyD family secretion protein
MVQNASPRGWAIPTPKRSLMYALGATLLVLIGSSVLYFTRFQRAQPTVEAPRSAPSATINALGRIEPAGEVVRVSAPATSGTGSRIQELRVREGDRVEAGQIIAVLDSRDRLAASLREAETQVEMARSRLAQVKAGAKPDEIEARQAAVSNVAAELNGAVQEQQAKIERLRAALQNAEVEYQRHESLYQEGAISASTLDSRRLALQTAEQQLNEAEASLTRTQQTLTASMQEAEATVNQVAEIRPTDVAAAEVEVEGAIATVERVRAELALAYIRAPRAGRILRVHAKAGETVGENGIADFGAIGPMYVTAEIYESDISKIKVGQLAKISSPGNTFTGQLNGVVDSIGFQVAKRDVLDTDPTAATDARVIEVKIRLEPAASQQVSRLTHAQVNVEIAP